MNEIILVKVAGIPISVGVGTNCFEIKDGQIQDNIPQKLGAKSLEKYNLNFNEAKLAWKLQIFDKIEIH